MPFARLQTLYKYTVYVYALVLYESNRAQDNDSTR